MAKVLEGTITMSTSEYRPCIVGGKHKALFHRWSDKAEVAAPSVLRGGHSGGQLSLTVAIVEYEDGTVHEEYPYDIRFVNSNATFKDYCFEECDKA